MLPDLEPMKSSTAVGEGGGSWVHKNVSGPVRAGLAVLAAAGARGCRPWPGLLGVRAFSMSTPDVDAPPSRPPPQTHDIGFIMLSSFGNALDAQPPPAQAAADKYRKVLQTAAGSLAKR